jgi:hypothetical protein
MQEPFQPLRECSWGEFLLGEYNSGAHIIMFHDRCGFNGIDSPIMFQLVHNCKQYLYLRQEWNFPEALEHARPALIGFWGACWQ